MDLKLAGKRALVTGSSKGLGEVMARTLAQEGVKVIIHGRQADAAHAVADEIGSDSAAVVLGDLGDADALERIGKEATEAFGGVDILINNAGLFGPDSWEDMKREDWMAYHAVNVVAPGRLSALFAEQMRERQWGRLIHIGSISAGLALPMCPNYAASKSALASVSSTLAKVYGKDQITSNMIGVGTISNVETYDGVSVEANDGPDPVYEFMTTIPYGHYHINPIGRMGSPEEVAYAVTMLCSPRSSFINGALLRVDGGCVPTIGL